jgi:hypothetical protein
MASLNKLPGRLPDWAKCVVLVSQATIVAGSCGAVFLLMRLLSDTALPQAAQVQIGLAENRSETNGGHRVPGSVPIISDFVQAAAADQTPRPPDGHAAQDAPELGPAMRAAEIVQTVNPEKHAQAASSRSPNDGSTEASAAIPATPTEGEARKQAGNEAGGSTVPIADVRAVPAADAPLPDTRTGEQKTTAKGSSRTAAPDVQRPGTEAQPAGSRGFRSSPAKSQPIKGEAEAERRNEKRAQRTRTAAVQQQDPSALPPAAAAAQPAQERMRFLGIPMPTGTELKQCLLEFRC